MAIFKGQELCIGFFFRKKKAKLSCRILYLPRSIQVPRSSPGPQTDFTSHAPTSPTQPPRPSRLASPIPLLDGRYRRRRPGSDKCPTVGEARRNSIHQVVAVVDVVAVVVVVGLCSRHLGHGVHLGGDAVEPEVLPRGPKASGGAAGRRLRRSGAFQTGIGRRWSGPVAVARRLGRGPEGDPVDRGERVSRVTLVTASEEEKQNWTLRTSSFWSRRACWAGMRGRIVWGEYRPWKVASLLWILWDLVGELESLLFCRRRRRRRRPLLLVSGHRGRGLRGCQSWPLHKMGFLPAAVAVAIGPADYWRLAPLCCLVASRTAFLTISLVGDTED
jgi:hypothetical protein